MVLFALSKLKLRKYDLFLQYILLLSGDISLNPGPIQNPCKLCSKSVNKKVIFCQKCNFWFHKKCEMPNDEVLYNEIKQNKDYLYVCRACIETPIDLSNTNLYEHLSFSSEKHVDDGFYLTSQTASIENDNNFTENTSEFKVFEKGGFFTH